MERVASGQRSGQSGMLVRSEGAEAFAAAAASGVSHPESRSVVAPPVAGEHVAG